MSNENNMSELAELTARKLREVAKERGVKNVNSKNKEQLLAELQAEPTANLSDEQKEKLSEETLREIASLAKKLEKAKDKLAAARKEWNEKVSNARQALRDSIESGDQAGTDSHARLNTIKQAYQHQTEMEVGRTEVVSPLAEKVAKLDTALRKCIEESDQLGLKF